MVRIGVHNLTAEDEGRILRVIGDFVHPNYEAPSHYYDVALLRIPSAKFDEKVQPGCLYTKMDTPKRMIITGWGTYDEGNPTQRILEVVISTSCVRYNAGSGIFRWFLIGYPGHGTNLAVIPRANTSTCFANL